MTASEKNLYLKSSACQKNVYTVKSRAVERSTIQFGNLLAKSHSMYVSIKFPLHKQSENP